MKRSCKEIEEYLGIEEMFKESNKKVYDEIIDEYRKFEKMYNDNCYEFILKCDIESRWINIKDKDIVKNGKYVVVYIPPLLTFKTCMEGSPYEQVGKWHIEEMYGNSIDEYVKDFIDFEMLGKYWLDKNKKCIVSENDNEIIIKL